MKTRATKSGLTLFSIYEEDIVNGVLTVPEGVTKISSQAFSNGMVLLEKIIIPSSVSNIDYWTLQFLLNLKWIEVDADNSAYSSLNGVLFNKNKTVLIRFPMGRKTTSYTVPNGVTEIFEHAFTSCTSLVNVEIPNSVTIIDERAFLRCQSLINLTLPDSVKKIGMSAFGGCFSLIDIIIPNSVTEIEALAFSKCKSLKNVTLPCNITTVSSRLFYDCYELSTVTIPSSITRIADDAFEDCGRLLIKCCEDSVAVKYAKEHDIRYEIVG